MKYALVYDVNGSEQSFGYTDFIDYGEYSVAGIMREVKAAYGKEATP